MPDGRALTRQIRCPFWRFGLQWGPDPPVPQDFTTAASMPAPDIDRLRPKTTRALRGGGRTAASRLCSATPPAPSSAAGTSASTLRATWGGQELLLPRPGTSAQPASPQSAAVPPARRWGRRCHLAAPPAPRRLRRLRI